MTWTRLDDNWDEDPVFDALDYDVRWHYLTMIQLCSRSKRHDGVMPLRRATSCSDVPDQTSAVGKLIEVGLLQNLDGAAVKVVRIEKHVPSADLLAKLEQDRSRAQRYRKHKAGDHSLCSPDRCSDAPSRDASSSFSRDARDGDGTGRAVTGSTTPTLTDEESEMLAEIQQGYRDDDPDLRAHLDEAS